MSRDEQIARAVREACAKVCEKRIAHFKLMIDAKRDIGDGGHARARIAEAATVMNMIKEIPPSDHVAALPKQEPFSIIYEWDTARGIHKGLAHEPYNGQYPDRAIPVYAAPVALPGVTDYAGHVCPACGKPAAQPDAEEVRDVLKIARKLIGKPTLNDADVADVFRLDAVIKKLGGSRE